MFKNFSTMSLLLAIGALVMLFSASNAYALYCRRLDSGSTSEQEELGISAYLTGSANGKEVWRSRTYTHAITCTSELRSKEADEEAIYVYPFPQRAMQTLPSGVKMGLIFNNEDLGVFDASGNVYRSRVDTGFKVKKNGTKKFDVTFRAYLVKEGEIKTNGVGEVTLFQLDGKNGLNPEAGRNYKLSITGWDKIGSVNCRPAIEAKPTTIPPIDTDKALSGEATAAISAATIRVTCRSETPKILDYLRAVSGTLTATGSAAGDNADYFASDKTGLGVGVFYGGAILKPGGDLKLSVPIRGGSGGRDLTFTLKPHLTRSLAPGTPAWVFSAQENDITSGMLLTFTPELVETD